jgi:hypothetical protein
VAWVKCITERLNEVKDVSDGWGGRWVGCLSLAAHPSATHPHKVDIILYNLKSACMSCMLDCIFFATDSSSTDSSLSLFDSVICQLH